MVSGSGLLRIYEFLRGQSAGGQPAGGAVQGGGRRKRKAADDGETADEREGVASASGLPSVTPSGAVTPSGEDAVPDAAGRCRSRLLEAAIREAVDPSATIAAHASGGEPSADPTCVAARHRHVGAPGLPLAFTRLSPPLSPPAAPDCRCVAAMDMFIDALGAEAANLALRVQAYGGIFIAGGVAAKIAARLTAGGRLRSAYLDKGRSVAAYSGCPLYVVTVEGDDLAMNGAWASAQALL